MNIDCKNISGFGSLLLKTNSFTWSSYTMQTFEYIWIHWQLVAFFDILELSTTKKRRPLSANIISNTI